MSYSDNPGCGCFIQPQEEIIQEYGPYFEGEYIEEEPIIISDQLPYCAPPPHRPIKRPSYRIMCPSQYGYDGEHGESYGSYGQKSDKKGLPAAGLQLETTDTFRRVLGNVTLPREMTLHFKPSMVSMTYQPPMYVVPQPDCGIVAGEKTYVSCSGKVVGTAQDLPINVIVRKARSTDYQPTVRRTGNTYTITVPENINIVVFRPFIKVPKVPQPMVKPGMKQPMFFRTTAPMSEVKVKLEGGYMIYSTGKAILKRVPILVEPKPIFRPKVPKPIFGPKVPRPDPVPVDLKKPPVKEPPPTKLMTDVSTRYRVAVRPEDEKEFKLADMTVEQVWEKYNIPITLASVGLLFAVLRSR